MSIILQRLTHSRLSRLRVAWLCLIAFMSFTLVLGNVTEFYHYQSGYEVRADLLVLRLGVMSVVFLLVVFVLFTSSLIFWKAETEKMGLLLALSLLFYWTTDSTPFDMLTDPEFSPFYMLFRPPILLMRAAALPMALALLFTFPDGKFSPRWTRWLLMGYSLLTTVYLLVPDLPTNTIYGATWRQTLEVSFVVAVIPFAVGIYAQVQRYRRVSPEHRNQLKWTALGMIIMIIGVILYYGVYVVGGEYGNVYEPTTIIILEVIRQFIQLTLAVILPITCLLIAIFRYRLWSADPIINRVLVYTAFVGIISLIYFVSIIMIGLLFSTINFAVSIPVTIFILFIFQPVREATQRTVNHLMFGDRNNPYAVMSQLHAEVQASATPDAVLPAIAEMLAQALKVPHIAIALRENGVMKVIVLFGQTLDSQRLVRFPMNYGQTVGEIVLRQDWGDRSLSVAERHLIENVAQQTAIIIHTMQLNSALQQSRQQLITAREEERRRLRRDLHDGLGPTLASHALKVGKARTLIPDKPQIAVDILSGLETDLGKSLTEIRRLVYDLRPPILDQLGLVGAIREFIDPLDGSSSGGVVTAFELELSTSLPPLSAAVEVATYRIVMEAVTNVMRHAHAPMCRIVLEAGNGVCLTIMDNGVGLPFDLRRGVGLTSIHERAEEVGGSVQFEPVSPSGLQVNVRLPFA